MALRRLRRPTSAIPTPAFGTLVLALLSYLPLLATHRGKLGADTKVYLYLNPAQLMRDAGYLWDSSTGLGTVTHQNIGYLFPMGPFYWLFDHLGVPDWIAQRLWLGSIIFLAGLGLRSFLKTLGWTGAGLTVASIAYAFSPYLLHYFYKHSVILLPFTALGWLLTCTVRSLRHEGWNWPARFALVALAAGGVNAPSLFFVLLAPLIWIIHAVWIDREVTARRALNAMLKIGLLSAVTSIWWVVSLAVAGAYGIDVVRYTESAKTVANSATAAEIWRSLGYWFMYGTDATGPWFKAAVTLTQSPLAIVVSFAIPTIACAVALWTRFRYRMFFVALVVTGVFVSVGAHETDQISLFGRFVRAVTSTPTGLGFRSTPRAVPLLALSFAVFLGIGVNQAKLRLNSRALRHLPAIAAIVLVLANMSPVWTGRMLDETLERPNDVPQYWSDAAASIDANPSSQRAFEMPGIEFADYRWGSTVDPITPGIMNTDYVARELVPQGSQASANLINAIDAPLQNSTASPDALAPLMRLVGVDTVIARNDLAFEKYRTPRPRALSALFHEVVGFEPPQGFGDPVENVAAPSAPLIDAVTLTSPYLTDPPPVEVFGVSHPVRPTRLVSAESATVLSGDGDGIVSAAQAGLLDPNSPLLYSGSISQDHQGLVDALGPTGRLIVTDSNRKAGRRWGTTKDNDGYTERADETSPVDPTDRRIDFFGRDDTATQTVAQHDGGLQVTASSYGNPFSYTPIDRPINATDGYAYSAWKTAAFSDARGEWIDISSTTGPIQSPTLHLTQAQLGVNRWIARVRITFDGDASTAFDVDLDDQSRTPAGTDLSLPKTGFESLRIEILATDRDNVATFQALSGVGFAELDFRDGRRGIETIRVPTDLTTALGEESANHELEYVLSRRRAPAEAEQRNEERFIRRRIEVPTARSFALRGSIELSPNASDAVIDELTGITGPRITSSSSLERNTNWRSSKIFDGDPATGWVSAFWHGEGAWIDISSPTVLTTTSSAISVLDDGRHSVPTAIHFEVDGTPSASIPLNTVGTKSASVTTYSYPSQTLTGSHIRLVVDTIREVTSPDWLDKRQAQLPIAITELQAPGIQGAIGRPNSPTFEACRDDLLRVNGNAVSIRVHGDRAAAERGRSVGFELCSPSASVPAGPGPVLIESQPGRDTGLDINMVVLSSPPASSPAGVTAEASSDSLAVGSVQPPNTDVTRNNHTSFDIDLHEPLSHPAWLVFGQSLNSGWELHANGQSLGAPQLIDGYANGWKLTPDQVGSAVHLELRWRPQRYVWWALNASGFAALLCLVLACRPTRAMTPPRPLAPTSISVFDDAGALVSTSRAVLFGVAAGVVASILISISAGFAIGIAAGAALRVPKAWPLLRIATVSICVCVAAYIVARQVRNDFPLGFDWPQRFDLTHQPMLTVAVLLGIEALVEGVRGGWRRKVSNP